MFFRRERPKVTTFSQRLESLKQAGFGLDQQADGRYRITKHGVGAVIGDGRNEPEIDKAGILVGSEIAHLLSGGYQMFLETPTGRRLPANDVQLRNLHEFEEDVKEALGLTSLYNTSLGTTSQKHMYDRVTQRDTGHQPKPWERIKVQQSKP